MKQERNSLIGLAAGIAAGVSYGMNPLFAKPLLADGVSIPTMLFFRYAISVIIMAVWMKLKGESFRVKANAKRGAGFLFSHIVNYCLQMLTLNFFLWLGLSKAVAPIPMFCICVPINFLLVRFFLKR